MLEFKDESYIGCDNIEFQINFDNTFMFNGTRMVSQDNTGSNGGEIFKDLECFETVDVQKKERTSTLNRYQIFFSKTIPEYIIQLIETTRGKIFKTTKCDPVKLLERDDCEYTVNDKTYKSYRFKNIFLPYILTIKELKNICAFICSSKTDNVKLIPINNEKTNELFCEDVAASTNNLHYIDLSCIGNESYIIQITEYSQMSNIEETFWKTYFAKICLIYDCLQNSLTQKFNTLTPHIFITQIKYYLIYNYGSINVDGKQVWNDHYCVNIIKLFNIHHPGDKFAKIYINSRQIDNYKLNARELQYIKIPKDGLQSFKGVASLYNTCSLYAGYAVNESVVLNRIDVMKNNVIEFTFVNTDTLLSYDQLHETTLSWLIDNKDDLLRKMRLDECIYTIDFDIGKYKLIDGSISANITSEEATINNIDIVDELKKIDILNDKFRTKTSASFNGFCDLCDATHAKMLYHIMNHEALTDTIVLHDIFPNVHIGINGNHVSILLSSYNSYGCLLQTLLIIYGLFEKTESNGILEGENDIDAIRKRGKKMGKHLLNVLKEQDPTLFGERTVKGKKRQYSGLCQKVEQRVIPVSEQEYEMIRKEFPQSVANIQNQTYKDRRLYIFCPFEEFSFLNYHHFAGQMCIPRCTTKSSNKSQYEHCAMSLSSEGVTVIKNKYENQTITLYNPLISKGRKCKVPDELKLMFPEYILQKINLRIGIAQHCLNLYDAFPFIIQRSPDDSTYIIKSGIPENVDSVLILQEEVNGEYFVLLHEFKSTPILFSQNEFIAKFFKSQIKKSEIQLKFIDYIGKVLDIETYDYIDMALNDILRKISNEYNVSYIVNGDEINGILYKDVCIMTPTIYVVGVAELVNISMKLVMTGEHGYKFASINEFDINNIDTLFVDYLSRKVMGIRYFGVFTFVEPFEITAKYSNITVMYFDRDAVVDRYVMDKTKHIQGTKLKRERQSIIENIIKVYAFIYVSSHDHFDKEDMKIMLRNLGVIYEKDSFPSYVDSEKTIISWRKSKINEKDYDRFFENNIMETEDHIRNMYNHLEQDLALPVLENEIIYSKIITS